MTCLVGIRPVDSDETEKGTDDVLARVLVEVLSKLRP
jgi:hypothetical protein